jgi:RNA polymerase sigma-70 factor (ECF subfamily)
VKSQALFVPHRDWDFLNLTRIVGHTDAPDLTQDVYLRVARIPVPDTTTDGERAWVFLIARNLALNYQRDQVRRPNIVELTDAPRAASQETTLAMRDALAELAPIDRDVFLLREVVGLSYDEIAASCEISHAAVRSRLHRARQQLREYLRPQLRAGGAAVREDS